MPFRKVHRTMPFSTSLRVAVTAAFILLVASGATASAGTYIHATCGSADVADSTSGWFAVGPPQPAGETGAANGCGGEGLFAQVKPNGQTAVAPGTGAGWRYVPPSGTRIQSAALDVDGWGTEYNGMVTDFALIADGAVTFSMAANGGSTLWDARRVGTGPLNASGLQAMIRCAPAGSQCLTIFQLGFIHLRNLAVTLADESLPTASGPVSGSLKDDQIVDGFETIAFAAADGGSGLRELQLLVDGTRVAQSVVSGGTCTPLGGSQGSWVFSVPRPCPATATVNVGLDLRQVADGTHDVSVQLVDAAGNAATIYQAAKLVANAPPVNTAPPLFTRADLAASPQLGETLRADRGTWSGPNLDFSYQWQRCEADGEPCAPIADATALIYTPVRADEGARLRLAVTAKNVVSATRYTPLTGVVRRAGAVVPAGGAGLSTAGNPNGNGVPAGGTACPGDAVRLSVPAIRGGVLRLRLRTRSTLRVMLVCSEDGRPVAGAALHASTETSGDPARRADLLITDGDGGATLKLDGRASRTVSISYRLRGDDALPRANVVVRVRVRGQLTFNVARSGSAARFTGRVLGGHVPARGVSVQLQWRDGQRWRPVAMLKTDRTGRYRYTYRFSSRARGFRYAFRTVVTPGQTDYPFLPATSGIRRAGR